jgi:ABC-type phosphate/phosphonate transport system permease subunit
MLNFGVFAVLIVSGLFFMTIKSVPKGIIALQLFTNLILGVFAGTNALFYYLICDRALKPIG